MKSSLLRYFPAVLFVVCVGFSLAWSFGAKSGILRTETQRLPAVTGAAETREPKPQMVRAPEVAHVTAADFNDQVLESDMPVLVDFYADWCGPCQLQAPVLSELAREMHAVKIVKVNVDENEELVQRYRIISLPTLLVFNKGEEVNHYIGYASKERLKVLLPKS